MSTLKQKIRDENKKIRLQQAFNKINGQKATDAFLSGRKEPAFGISVPSTRARTVQPTTEQQPQLSPRDAAINEFRRHAINTDTSTTTDLNVFPGMQTGTAGSTDTVRTESHPLKEMVRDFVKYPIGVGMDVYNARENIRALQDKVGGQPAEGTIRSFKRGLDDWGRGVNTKILDKLGVNFEESVDPETGRTYREATSFKGIKPVFSGGQEPKTFREFSGKVAAAGGDIAGYFMGGSAIKSAIKPGIKGFLSRAKPAVIAGAETLAPIMFGESLATNVEGETKLETAKRVATSSAVGLALGSVFGLAGHGFVEGMLGIASKIMKKNVPKPNLNKFNREDYDNDVDFFLDVLGFDDAPTKTQLKKRTSELSDIYYPGKYADPEAKVAAAKRYTEVNEASSRLMEFVDSKPEKTPKGTAPTETNAKPLEDVVDIGTVARRDDLKKIKESFNESELEKLQEIQEEEIFRTNKIAQDVVKGEISFEEATKRMNQIKTDSYNATLAIKNKPKIKKATRTAAVAVTDVPVDRGTAIMTGSASQPESVPGAAAPKRTSGARLTTEEVGTIKDKAARVNTVGREIEETLLKRGVDIETAPLEELDDIERAVTKGIESSKTDVTVESIVDDVLAKREAAAAKKQRSVDAPIKIEPAAAVEAPKRVAAIVENKPVVQRETYRQVVQRLFKEGNKDDVSKLLKYAKENKVGEDAVITPKKLNEILSTDVVLRDSPGGLIEYTDDTGIMRLVTEDELAAIRKAKMTPEDFKPKKEKKFKEIVKKDNNGDEYVVYEEYSEKTTPAENLSRELQDAFNEGETEDYFVALANSRTKAGDDDGAEIITNFITDKFGNLDPNTMYSNLIPYGKELLDLIGKITTGIVHFEKPLNKFLQAVGGKLLGKGENNAIRKLMVGLTSLSRKVKDDKGKVIDVQFPFEVAFGVQKNITWGPWNGRLKQLQAGVKIDALNLAKYFERFDDKTQLEIIKRIEEGPQNNGWYGSDKIGEAAKYIEGKFMTVLAKLIEAGLVSPKVALEYWGKYFPRSIEKERKRYGFAKLLKLRFKDYNKVRHDAFGIIEKNGEPQKFETEAERDLAAIKLNKKGRQYTTFDPATPESVAKAGGYRHPLIAMTERYYHEANDIALVKFFNEIAGDKRIFSDKEDILNGFVNQVPKEKEWGKIGGKYVHKAFETEILATKVNPEDFDAILRGIQEFNSLAKAFKTVYEPAVHAANFVSNIMLIDASGIPVMPHHITDAFMELLPNAWGKPGKYYKEMIENGITGRTFAQAELGEILGFDIQKKLKKLLDNLPKDASWIDVWGHALKELPLLLKKSHEKLSDIYGGSEDLGKLVVYKYWRQKGDTILEAGRKANGALFDYSTVPDWLAVYRKAPIIAPAFVTFAYKMAEKLVIDAPKNPFSYMKLAAIIMTITNALLREEGVSPDDIDKIKPEYVGDWTVPLSVERDENGNVTNIPLVDLTRYFPIGQLTSLKNVENKNSILPSKNITDYIPRPKLGSLDLSGAGSGGLISAFKPGGIVAPTAYNLLQNKSPFSGKEIANELDSLTERIIDRVNYFTTNVGPSWTPPIPGGGKEDAGGSLFSKYKKAGVLGPQQYDYYGEPYKLSDALLRTVGTKIININPERQTSFAVSDLREQINSANGEIRTLLTESGNIKPGRPDREFNIEKNKSTINKLRERIKQIEVKIKEVQDVGALFNKKKKDGVDSFFDLFKIKGAGAAEFANYDKKMSNAYEEAKILSAFKGKGGIKDILSEGNIKKETDIVHSNFFNRYKAEDGKYADNQKWFIENVGLSSYATSKEHRERLEEVYRTTPDMRTAKDVRTFLKATHPRSPIISKADAIIDAAEHYGLSPRLMIAVARQDSGVGTEGVGADTKNIGNVGNTGDATEEFDTWEEGIVAMARNLAERKSEHGQSIR